MKKVNVTELMDFLSDKEYVSVPIFMTRFDMNYGDAEQLMREIIGRGWAEKNTCGVEYKIIKTNISLVRLGKEEIKEICKRFENAMGTVLSYLFVNGSSNFKDISEAVHGEYITKESIRILTNKKMIYKYDEKYHLRIDAKSVLVISRFSAEKSRILRMKHVLTLTEKEIDELIDKLYDEPTD